MDDDRSTLRRVAWKEIFPWLILVKTFRLSLRLPILICAMAALLVLPLGWKCAEFLFIGDAQQSDPAIIVALESNGTLLPSTDRTNTGSPRLENWNSPERPLSALLDVFLQISSPFRHVFRAELDVTKVAYFLFGGLWTVLIWSVAAAVITRLAGVEIALEQRLPIRNAIRHATSNFLAYFSAALYPQFGVLLIMVPLVIVGFMMKLDVGVLAAGVLWPLVLLGGLILAILLLGLTLGWPLMWPVISLEDQRDAFEALSRSYSFALQKPLHYLFYVAIASAIGGLGMVFVSTFAAAVVELSYWGVSWGAGNQRLAEVTGGDSSSLIGGGMWFLDFWNGSVLFVARAYRYSFFWCAMTAIYLLLRKDIDATEFDDIYIDEKENRIPQRILESIEPPEDADTSSNGTPSNESPSKVNAAPPTSAGSVPSDNA